LDGQEAYTECFHEKNMSVVPTADAGGIVAVEPVAAIIAAADVGKQIATAVETAGIVGRCIEDEDAKPLGSAGYLLDCGC